MFRHSYIVTLKKGVNPQSFIHEMTHDNDCHECIPVRAVTVSDELPLSLRSTSFELTPEEAIVLRAHPDVASVDREISKSYKSNFARQTDLFFRNSHLDPYMTNWGLRKTNLENHTDQAKSYVYDYVLDGTGVDIVIQDDGVDAQHPEFLDENGVSRVQEIDWYAEVGVPGTMPAGHYTITDTYHGTHVAGIAAGKTYGWAKKARIYSIRFDLMPTGHEFDLVRLWHEQKPVDPVTGVKRPTIVNASWGYGWYWPGHDAEEGFSNITEINFRGQNVGTVPSTNYQFPEDETRHGFSYGYVDAAVEDMIDAGVIFVCAAGNTAYKLDVPGGIDYNNHYKSDQNWPAGTDLYPVGQPIWYNRPGSPTASNAIIVGNIDSKLNPLGEGRASSSERGPAVNIWAPGTDIYSAGSSYAKEFWIFEFLKMTTQYRDDPNWNTLRLGGTSMASPQVSGLLTLFLQLNPHATQDDCIEWLTNHASKNTLVDTGVDDASNRYSLLGSEPRVLFNPYASDKSHKINQDASRDVKWSLEQTDMFLDEHTEETTVFTLTTHGLPDGSQVPYKITGLSENDIYQPLVGVVNISNNTGTLEFKARRDFNTDGVKAAKLIVGRNRAVSYFLINDTSIGQAYVMLENIRGLDNDGNAVEGTQIYFDFSVNGLAESGRDSVNMRWWIQGPAGGGDIQPYASVTSPNTISLTEDYTLTFNIINETSDFFNETGEFFILMLEQQMLDGSWRTITGANIGIVQPPIVEWQFNITATNQLSDGRIVEGSQFTITCTASPEMAPIGTQLWYQTTGNAQAGVDYFGFNSTGTLTVNNNNGTITVHGFIPPYDSPYEGTEAAVILFYDSAQRNNQVGQLVFYITDQF